MKQDVSGAKHYRAALAATPQDVRQQMEWSFHIADEIDDALKAKGMTQKELADRLGTSAAAVSRWLSGGHNFTLSTLAKISTELGIPLISVSR
jgi:ribosome-binding protein aMBF1 (putative translation factor)